MPVKEQNDSQLRLPEGAWSIDRGRSSVSFAIKHMAMRTLHGSFHEFEGAIDLAANPARADGTVVAASINTGERVRDEHLRDSPDFFDVEHHPEIRFRSTEIVAMPGNGLRVEGDLSMRGVTHPIVLEGRIERGPVESEATPTINVWLRGELSRKDFGLTWNQALDTGGALLGNRVRVELKLAASA